MDATYIRRVLRDGQRNPSRELVKAFGAALKEQSRHISDKDVGRLLRSAGHPFETKPVRAVQPEQAGQDLGRSKDRRNP